MYYVGGPLLGVFALLILVIVIGFDCLLCEVEGVFLGLLILISILLVFMGWVIGV